MRSLMKSVLILGLVASLAVGAAGCGSTPTPTPTPSASPTSKPTVSPTPSPTVAATPYKIGAIFSVTGANSPLGTPEKQTVEMMVEQINAKGGINGHLLQAVIYDDKTDATEAVTLTKKLIEQDNVLAIIGPSGSPSSVAIIDTVMKAGTPLITCAASDAITKPVENRTWVFSTPQLSSLAVEEIIDHLTKTGVKKVALLTDSNTFGATGRDALLAALPKVSITISADEKYNTADTDMTAQLTKIKGTEAQAVIVWGTNPGPAIIAKNMKQLAIALPLYNSHGIANLSFITLAGDAANGVMFPAGKLLVIEQLDDTDPQKAVLLQYKKDFEAKYGAGNANTFGGHAYDALTMVVKALTAVGADKAKIRDYIENNVKNLALTVGVFNMSPTDHNGLTKAAFEMIKIADQKWTWLK
jgi:branched-chain amino acid transport system substrate-binding protein